MRDAYKCGFIGCRNATIAASACGDRANGVCGISMDLGLALVDRGKCRASARHDSRRILDRGEFLKDFGEEEIRWKNFYTDFEGGEK